MTRRLLGLAILLGIFSPSQLYASVFGAVKAIVHDPQHRPVKGAEVVAQSRSSAFKVSGTTNDEGIATVLNVPVGEYDITVAAKGFTPENRIATVSSGNVQELHFALTVASVKEVVEVSGAPQMVNPSSSTSETLVSRAEIAQTPGVDRTNSMSMITDFVPGAVMVHDQLHVRGGHQVTWAIDGVPVPNTNIASNVGPQFDPKDIDYLEVQRGSYSAEMGDRTYGVFNVVPRTGFERSRQGELVASYGNYNTTDNQLSFGDHNDRSAYYFSLNGNRTDHGLAPPTPAVLHDQAAGGGLFTSLIHNITPNDQLRFVGSGRTDYFQVPNDPDAQRLGVRDREREQDAFANFSWIHTFNAGVVLTLSPSYHFNRAAFEGAGDTADRVVTTDNRASSYLGGQAELSIVKGRHNAKAGFYGFSQHDNTLFGLVGTNVNGDFITVNPPREKVNGDLEALFVEDQYKVASWLTLNAGVRFTRFAGSITETVASPRAGVAIQVPKLKWVLRAAYSRYYQAPPLDTLSGPLLQAAQDVGLGFIPLRGERDEQHEFGLTIPVQGWVLDFAQFRTGAHNFFDHDVIGNSNVFFPLTLQSVRIVGYEATMRSPHLWKQLDLRLVYSHQSAEGSGARTGGLTDFSPPAGGFFFLDHDQRNTLSAGFTELLPLRFWMSGNVSYGSGFLNGNGPGHLPAYGIVDLAVGKSFGENWSAKLTATNIADHRYFVDLSNTFGGSHVGEPRMVSVQVRYRFHY
jgi:outer membrane receptor protein involved in Fe transport